MKDVDAVTTLEDARSEARRLDPGEGAALPERIGWMRHVAQLYKNVSATDLDHRYEASVMFGQQRAAIARLTRRPEYAEDYD
ncbi:AMED_5909 family protein [Amycolatopsis rubida]|uniref:Uncharacterized protein n=1 Tax=Amycolatopsis rubida TaxID=112413 RepID=A0A1I6A4D1_9PSEU|nr:AMED_5909 family protein [Amycolatopsis rubida]SFQ63584.1 hypothetical protein SAMN05421854_11796 [Amycolatopsis rubida]